VTAAAHPGWCISGHSKAPRVHSAGVGALIDLPAETSLYVELLQVDGQDVQVLLGEQHSVETSVRSLTLEQALQLRDNLNTATALALREEAFGG
jgi:hypothetical protein